MNDSMFRNVLHKSELGQEYDIAVGPIEADAPPDDDYLCSLMAVDLDSRTGRICYAKSGLGFNFSADVTFASEITTQAIRHAFASPPFVALLKWHSGSPVVAGIDLSADALAAKIRGES